MREEFFGEKKNDLKFKAKAFLLGWCKLKTTPLSLRMCGKGELKKESVFVSPFSGELFPKQQKSVEFSRLLNNV